MEKSPTFWTEHCSHNITTSEVIKLINQSITVIEADNVLSTLGNIEFCAEDLDRYVFTLDEPGAIEWVTRCLVKEFGECRNLPLERFISKENMGNCSMERRGTLTREHASGLGSNRKRERGYFPRVRALWNLPLIADPRGMADVHPRQVARMVGCSERTARRHWWWLVRGG